MAFAPTSGKPRSSARRGRKPRGENNARPGQATPSARRGAAAVAPPPPHVNPGQIRTAPPGPRPPVPQGCPGAGRGPGGDRDPAATAASPARPSLTGRQPGQQQRPPAAPALGHGAASSTRPGTSGRATPPRPRALPFPWHLSQGRAPPPAAVPSLRGPSAPARRQVRLPASAPAPSAAKPGKILQEPAASFRNCF